MSKVLVARIFRPKSSEMAGRASVAIQKVFYLESYQAQKDTMDPANSCWPPLLQTIALCEMKQRLLPPP